MTNQAQTKRFSWKDAPDLMDRLTSAQNHPRNENQDIMTYAGMCDSRAELERHVTRYEELARRYDFTLRCEECAIHPDSQFGVGA